MLPVGVDPAVKRQAEKLATADTFKAVAQEFLAQCAMGLYLARWGFTPMQPIRRAYEQSPATVRRWLDEEYPAIAPPSAKDRVVVN